MFTTKGFDEAEGFVEAKAVKPFWKKFEVVLVTSNQ
jgi:hypothetical protein